MKYLALVLCALGCSSTEPAPARVGVSTSALVTLVKLEAPKPEPVWTQDGEPGWTGMRARYVPYCNAFGVRRLGRVQLASAAHCLPKSGEVRYWQTLGIGRARVSYVSEARDVAYLDPLDEIPAALERAPI